MKRCLKLKKRFNGESSSDLLLCSSKKINIKVKCRNIRLKSKKTISSRDTLRMVCNHQRIYCFLFGLCTFDSISDTRYLNSAHPGTIKDTGRIQTIFNNMKLQTCVFNSSIVIKQNSLKLLDLKLDKLTYISVSQQ